MTSFQNAHSRKPVVFADARLARAIYSNGRMCASVTEYSTSTGIPVLDLLDMLDEQISNGNLGLEFCGGEIFVHTAPGGRGSFDPIPYNVWETIRKHNEVEQAYAVWLLARELEHAGWALEYNLYNVTGDPALAQHFGVQLGLRLRQFVIPLIDSPYPDFLTSEGGALDTFARRSYALLSMRCKHGDLDRSVTAVRTWYMHNKSEDCSGILVLEQPHNLPLLLLREDGGLEPRSLNTKLAHIVK